MIKTQIPQDLVDTLGKSAISYENRVTIKEIVEDTDLSYHAIYNKFIAGMSTKELCTK